MNILALKMVSTLSLFFYLWYILLIFLASSGGYFLASFCHNISILNFHFSIFQCVVLKSSSNNNILVH